MLEWFLLAKEGATAVGADVLVALAGIAGATAIIIQSLRKRKDVDIAEIIQKNETLDKRVGLLEEELVRAVRDRFLLRLVLAENGWPDPTLEETA